MIFPAENFVGRADGEDLFYNRMSEYLPNSYVSFHNQDIGMEEADVILLVPNKGIVVIEIKSNHPENIDKAKDNKYILKTNGDVIFSPFKQAARYRDALVADLKRYDSQNGTEYAKHVIAHVPCFPYFTRQDLSDKQMGRICKESLFITSEDLDSFDSFSNRLEIIFECANQVGLEFLKRNFLPTENIIGIGNVITPNALDESSLIKKEEVVKTDDDSYDYSILYVCADLDEESDQECEKIVSKWRKGTKVYYFSRSKKTVEKLISLIKNIADELYIKKYDKNYDELNIANLKEKYGFFNFTIEYSNDITDSFEVINGVADDSQKESVNRLGKYVHFNVEQYWAEHAEQKNMLVNAGAGTGKTYLLVSRIAYLCWKNDYNSDDLQSKIALITFTNDATDEMRSRLEGYYSKMFLLTFKRRFYDYVCCVENMTISTIDSFSKKIVSRFAYNLGVGEDLGVTSATLIKQKCVREEINDYLVNEKKASEVAIPSYEMAKYVLELIKKIEDRNKDPRKIQDLFDKSFEEQANIDINSESVSAYDCVQKDLASMFIRVPKIMCRIEDECYKQNQMLMGQIIVTLRRVVDRIKSGEIKKPQDVKYEFVFIDEFQDTDDQQIALVAEFQKLFEFKLFVVGDVKQSIYRFRGASDDRAFTYLNELSTSDFLPFNLVKNYRTNVKMLEFLDGVFKRLNAKKGARRSKGLLAYGEKDVLVGVNNPDYPAQISKYYFSSEAERENYICNIIKNHTADKGKMAILVRKNSQVAEIKRICQKNEIYNVNIDTGGSLYQHEAVIDLYKLSYALQNAGDGVALFNLYTTAYVNESLDKNDLYAAADKKVFFETHLPQSLSKWKEYIKQLQEEPILRVIHGIIDDVCPWNIYAQRLQCGSNEKRIATLRYKNNLEKLFEKIAVETNGLYLTLNSLVESLRIMITTSQEEEERPVEETFDIQCRTVHRSKGKEYEYVFLPYADDTFEKGKPKFNSTFIINESGIGYFIPIDGTEYKNDIFDREDQKEREDQSYEEARIFYVALTRAKVGIIYLETAKKNSFQTSWSEMLKEN